MIKPNHATLREARLHLLDHLEEGLTCPCCGQFAKVYRRSLNSGMARSLIEMYRAGAAEDFIHLPTTISLRSREEGKLRFWGLVEEDVGVREDGGRAGWWQLTRKGRLFVRDRLAVPKYVLLYNNTFQSFDGDEVRITDCLGDKFDYAELMGRKR